MAHSDSRSRGRSARAIGVGLLTFVGLTALASAAVFQRIAESRDRRAFPPPGTLVDVGGHRLHLWCQGEGNPTVVLEAGLSSPALSWALVQPKVAAFTRVCSYDRAGYGWSDVGPKPRSAEQISQELHQLLLNAGVPGPYVLVGHSLGGLYVRVFAHRYPEDAAGLVLVDTGHEDQRHRMPSSPWRRRLGEELVWQRYRLNPFLARLGMHRWQNRPSGVVDALPASLRPAARAIGLQARSYDWIFGEGGAVRLSEEQVRHAKALLEIPLIVVSAPFGGPKPGERAKDELFQRRRRIWMELQRELTGLSSQGTQMIAEQSGHMVPLDQPDVVVEAIRRVVSAVRRDHR